MKCQEFWNTMPELSPGEEHLDHARECAHCAALLSRQLALGEGLHAMAVQWRHVEAPARTEQRLVAAFRSHNGLEVRRRMPWLPVLTWVTAAAAVAGLALFLVRDRPAQPGHRKAASQTELAMVLDSAEPDADAFYSEGDFIPLPNAEQIAPNEDVNLVRVEVPRSSMIALGFEVSAERASEPVEAEVVLGADGQARAVRFLDE